MTRQHDAVISIREFWQVLGFVVLCFGVALALSWTIDAAFPHQAQAMAAKAQTISG
jgi:hypothetical protein